MFRDSRRIMVGMRGMDDKVDEILSFLSHRFPGWCDVPGFPEFVVGLDEPLEELKLVLLKDGVSVLVLSAPGGCGKTTLAKMLCHDAQIRGILDFYLFIYSFINFGYLNVLNMVKRLDFSS